MNRKFQLLFITLMPMILLALVASVAHASKPPDDPVIRVGLVSYGGSTKQITVLASSNFSIIKTGTTDKLASSTNLVPIVLEAGDTEITCRRADDSLRLGASVTIVPDDPSATIAVDSPTRSRQYRGAIEVSFKGRTLRLVNVVKIDDYLLGVVPCEMGDAPEEALKAQAIAARSYTIRNQRKHSSDGYGLCDTTHCQSYGGVLAERAATTKAVLATRGMTLNYGGEPISAMYSTDCGGITQSYADSYRTGQSQHPYLCSVTEPSEVEHQCWEKTYTLADLGVALAKSGIPEANGLQSIKVIETAKSGRASSVEIVGAKGAKTVYGATLRKALDLKSTLFTIETSSEGIVTFHGKGYGHGIGMCQVGARALAGPPSNYTCERLLSFYYPGAELTHAYGSAASATSAPAHKKPAPTLVRTAKADPKPAKKPRTRDTERGMYFEVRVKAPSL